MSTAAVQGQVFQCSCGGPVTVEQEDVIQHACRRARAPATSYYDGAERFITWRRTQVDLALTNGQEKYNWFVDWK